MQFRSLFRYKLCACNMTGCHYIQALFHSRCAPCTADIKRDFRLPPQSRSDLHCCGLLYSELWCLVTNVTLPELVGNNLHNIQHSMQEWQVHYDAETTHATHNVAITNILNPNSHKLIQSCDWLTALLPSAVNSVKCKPHHINRRHQNTADVLPA